MKETSIDFRQAGHFQLDDPRMELLVTACRIHNGGMPQSDPTLAVCLDADRLDLGRVGITPDPEYLSTLTAKSIATRQAWHELDLENSTHYDENGLITTPAHYADTTSLVPPLY
jgi:hypothetical protein